MVFCTCDVETYGATIIDCWKIIVNNINFSDFSMVLSLNESMNNRSANLGVFV